MPDSWTRALGAYSYPVNLRDYDRAQEFPGFFHMMIAGDRNSTIAFENHYRETAPHCIAAVFEVVYWKLYSQGARCQRSTNRIVDFVQEHGTTSEQLWDATQRFAESQTINNLKRIRSLLGITTNVLAVALTLPALANPETIPMIDSQVANWVNGNALNHNIARKSKLSPFRMNYTSLRDNDFPNYSNWIAWCREVAQVLAKLTNEDWRARDVEMAVFTAQRSGIELNVLP